MPHEKVETEPGTIVHMERALQKVEHDKLHHNAKAWEENAKTKIESRYSTFNRFYCHINSLIITRVILRHSVERLPFNPANLGVWHHCNAPYILLIIKSRAKLRIKSLLLCVCSP